MNIDKLSGKFIFLIFLLFLLGCASSAKIHHTEIKDAIEIPLVENTRPLQFKKIVVKLNRGEDIGSIQGGLLCVAQADLVWKGGKIEVSTDEFTEVFRDELEKANYNIIGNTDSLFEDPSDWEAEYLIAGLIKEMQANICFPWSGLGNWSSGKGEAYMKVNWQLYSRLERKVVFETITEGSSDVDDSSPTGPTDVFLNAFASATKNLLADKGFHDLLTQKEQINNYANSGQTKSGVINLNSKPLYTSPIINHINDIRSSVVTVFAGEGHGSGFFISSSGYVLTNEHVVRSAKMVNIKLATGREILGEVLRTDSRRDVALIKAEEPALNYLPLDKNESSIGEEVIAIGTPLDEKFSTTVSKGILSGYRLENGIRFIQSDVNVLPGNSGGPLLDENGNVIGISVSALFLHNFPSGINFFIPINEAINSMNIRFQPLIL